MNASPVVAATAPHLAAERSLLGAALLGDHVDVLASLQVADLELPRHATVLRAIEVAAAETGAASVVTVRAVLERWGRLAEVGGDAALLDWQEEAHLLAGSAQIAAHAQVVRDAADRRRIVAAARDALQAAQDGADVDAVRARLAQATEGHRPIGSALAGPLRPIGVDELQRVPEPRRYLLRHPDRGGVPVDDGQGDGLLPLSKTAILSSAGGVGKTRTVVEMAVAILTGRRWLDHYVVDREVSGDVLLVLAEDDHDDAQRAIWRAIEAMHLSDAERGQVARGLVVLGLAGQDVRLAMGEDGDYQPTRAHSDLLRALRGRQWALVVLDPLTRFAGVATDRDTDAGTYVVQLAEQVVEAAGGATVLFTAHSSKNSRSQGGADVRGVGSIVDGVRWVGTLVEDGEDVLFRQTKSNHSRPMPKPLRLVRDPGGRLRAQRAHEIADEAGEMQARADVADRDATQRLLEAVDRLAGVPTTKNDLCKAARVKASNGRVLIDLAVASGELLAVPVPGRRVSYRRPAGGPERAAQSPLYPRDRGTAEPVPASAVLGPRGTARDRGTVRGFGA